tara:strand:+ start:154 stop:1389 length:1236 start_codon:yes stop_codon:yes gene_type:complete
MSELDKTIEELEAEVLAELEEIEEANGADAPKKGAAPAEKSDLKDESEDTGAAVVAPDQKDAPAKKVAAKAKEVSGDAPQKGEGAPDKPEKLAAGDQVDHDGEKLEEAKSLTKAQHLEAIGKMKKAEIEEMIASHQKSVEEASEAKTEEELKALENAKAEIEEKIKSISVKEDVDALTEGEEFSEEFKKKAATVFEAAVKSKMRSEVERIVEAVNSEKEVEVETFKGELTEKVDTYLNYVVDEWTKENELAIERGLKGEIAEDFISGLKQLFEDHYIDVPDEKYDVLEAQSEKIAELEEKINEEIQKNVEISTSNSVLVREQVIAQVSEDLADTEIEKFKSLTEDVDFADEESFREKLSTLKESYFPKVAPSSSAGTSFDDEDGGTAQDVDTTDTMHKYMSAISRDHKASA